MARQLGLSPIEAGTPRAVALSLRGRPQLATATAEVSEKPERCRAIARRVNPWSIARHVPARTECLRYPLPATGRVRARGRPPAPSRRRARAHAGQGRADPWFISPCGDALNWPASVAHVTFTATPRDQRAPPGGGSAARGRAHNGTRQMSRRQPDAFVHVATKKLVAQLEA